MIPFESSNFIKNKNNLEPPKIKYSLMDLRSINTSMFHLNIMTMLNIEQYSQPII